MKAVARDRDDVAAELFRKSIESLRKLLEDGVITVSEVYYTLCYMKSTLDDMFDTMAFAFRKALNVDDVSPNCSKETMISKLREIEDRLREIALRLRS